MQVIKEGEQQCPREWKRGCGSSGSLILKWHSPGPSWPSSRHSPGRGSQVVQLPPEWEAKWTRNKHEAGADGSQNWNQVQDRTMLVVAW